MNKKLFIAGLILVFAVICLAADKIVQIGSTDVTKTIRFYDSTNGSAYTDFADLNDLDIYYIRVETDNDVVVSSKEDMSVLAGLTAAHANDGIYEAGYGYYRVDFNDAMFAIGATEVAVIIEDANNDYIFTEPMRFKLVDYDPHSTITAIKTTVDDANANTALILSTGSTGPWTSETTPEDIRDVVFAETGITAGGTWTFAEILKYQTAWQIGKWTDSNSTGTYNIADAEDPNTTVLQYTPSATSPQKEITVP